MSNEKEHFAMPVQIVRGIPFFSASKVFLYSLTPASIKKIEDAMDFLPEDGDIIMRGVPFLSASKVFTIKKVEDAMDFMPEDGDIIIASYPKTGTTWMQYIVLQIISGGELFPSFEEASYKTVPYIEMTGTDAVKVQAKPRMYKHHIPYDKVQKNGAFKCIYIYRHPEDTVVSYYHFTRNFFPKFTIDFNTFFEAFVAGNVPYGNYFRHILSFYEHREDLNLLMVSYEKQHADIKQGILRVAKFLGEDYFKKLSGDGQLLDRIVERTSFDYMKKNLTMNGPDDQKTEFFRKGIVGDGKAVLADSQRNCLKLAAEKVLSGTSILAEWYPH